MTAAKLRELEAKATEGPWNYTGQHYGDRGERFHVIEANGIEVTGEFGGPNKDDCELIAYLRNHCSDFIKLMEAAEEVVKVLDSDDKAIVDTVWVSDGMPETLRDRVDEALAAFKEKS